MTTQTNTTIQAAPSTDTNQENSASSTSIYRLKIGQPASLQGQEITIRPGQIYNLREGRETSWEEMVADLEQVKYIFMGETHTSFPMHEIQSRIIQSLVARGYLVGVCVEMLPVTIQEKLTKWQLGILTEEEFLREAQWYVHWGYNFGYYRPILDLIKNYNLPFYGVNVPREWITQVRMKGREALGNLEKNYIPPLDLSHKEHRLLIEAMFDSMGFPHQMKDQAKEKAFEAFYRAQVAWDQTMAFHTWQAAKKEDAKERSANGIGAIEKRIEEKFPKQKSPEQKENKPNLPVENHPEQKGTKTYFPVRNRPEPNLPVTISPEQNIPWPNHPEPKHPVTTSSEQNGTKTNLPVENHPEQKITEQKGKEQKSLKQNIPEQKSLEQRSQEQKGTEKKSTEKKDTETKSTELKGTKQNGTEQKGTEQKSLKQKSSEQNRTKPNLPVSISPEQNISWPNHPEPKHPVTTSSEQNRPWPKRPGSRTTTTNTTTTTTTTTTSSSPLEIDLREAKEEEMKIEAKKDAIKMVVLAGSGHFLYKLGINARLRELDNRPSRTIIALEIPEEEGKVTISRTLADYVVGLHQEERPRWPLIGLSIKKVKGLANLVVSRNPINGVAKEAGLRKGDVILEVDNLHFEDENELLIYLAQKHYGDEVQMVVLRNGETLPITLKF